MLDSNLHLMNSLSSQHMKMERSISDPPKIAALKKKLVARKRKVLRVVKLFRKIELIQSLKLLEKRSRGVREPLAQSLSHQIRPSAHRVGTCRTCSMQWCGTTGPTY